MTQIRRVTKLQKKIINAILEIGLNKFWYGSDDTISDLCYRFNVVEADIEACIQYITEKFCFGGV